MRNSLAGRFTPCHIRRVANKTELLTDSMITALRDEAGNSGETDMVVSCSGALEGNTCDRVDVCAAINTARARASKNFISVLSGRWVAVSDDGTGRVVVWGVGETPEAAVVEALDYGPSFESTDSLTVIQVNADQWDRIQCGEDDCDVLGITQ